MSITGRPKVSVGLRLLNLSTWVRGQPWLKAVYRHFPRGLRNKVSGALAARASEQTKFKRTSNWRHYVHQPALVQAKSIPCVEYDKAIGVNIFAYARGQFGLAEGARSYAKALLAEGYPVAIHDIAIVMPHEMDDTSLDLHIREETPYDINLIFVNPDYLDEAIASIGCERLRGRYTIGCWFWELEVFPEEWLPALQQVDEIMVSTSFIEEAVKRVTAKPVWHVPLPVCEAHDSGLMRSDFGLDDDTFVFLNSFDFNSFLVRKNPLAVIEAFRRAFADDPLDVRLLIKSSNGHRHPAKLQELLNAAAIDRRIIIRDDVIDRCHVQSLQRCVDAYVSLHRAEGFGLGLAECMRLGKPVIATGWSGNMEFMTPDNSLLVDYRLVPVNEGEYIHHTGQRWAAPDVDHAAVHMRRLVEDREFAAKIGARAACDIRDKLAPQATAQRIIQRLEVLSLFSDTSGMTGTDLVVNSNERVRTS